MNTIFKYQVEPGVFAVAMPAKAIVLSVQAQRDVACMWAAVDTLQPPTERWFRCAGTGHAWRDEDMSGATFVGTFQLEDGDLVLHLFELARKPAAAR
jgi:hypothetical protein